MNIPTEMTARDEARARAWTLFLAGQFSAACTVLSEAGHACDIDWMMRRAICHRLREIAA